MTNTIPHAVPESPTGNFHTEGRTVDAGRGWDWIVEGFALFRKQPGIWILTAVVLGVVFIVISVIPILFVAISIIPVLGSLASALLFPIFGGGLMLGCKALDQGGTLELGHLFAGFKQKTGDLMMVGAFNVLGWVVIPFAVNAVVGSEVFMGVIPSRIAGADLSIASLLAMLLVAGLSVPLSMATWFAPALIVLQDMAAEAALKASFFACLRNWIPFLVYGVVLLVLGIVAGIPLGLGYLIFVPVLVASIYTAYRDIFCAG